MNNLLIKQALAKEFNNLDDLLSKEITEHSSNIITDISHYIVSAGGKRIRPIILLLLTKMFGYNDNNNIKISAALELIHTATLLHDDIIDNSSMRRKKVSSHIKWGVRNSITVGDWLFALAFKLTVSCKDINLTKVISKMTNEMAKGELEQLYFKNSQDITENSYFEVITAKTGLLFSVATEAAAILSGKSKEDIEISRLFGLHLGLAFQIQDDILDYLGDAESLGKNVGDDIVEGKLTLPMIYLRQRNPEIFNKTLAEIDGVNSKEYIQALKNCLLEYNCIQDSQVKAEQQQSLALDYLNKLAGGSNPNIYKKYLEDITKEITVRNS